MQGITTACHYRELENQLPHRLKSAGFIADRPPEWAVAEDSSSGLRLHSWLWRHPHGLEARAAWITSPRAAIVNLMVFPAAADRIPVFASELIAFGTKVHVAVIDHQMVGGHSAHSDDLAQILRPLHARWQNQFPSGGDLPDWAHTHFTPWCIYTRGLPAEKIPLLEAAFLDYWDAWATHWLINSKNQESVHPAIHHYLHHHLVHTPGRTFLAKFFGENWAQQYLASFMYAPLHSCNTLKLSA